MLADDTSVAQGDLEELPTLDLPELLPINLPNIEELLAINLPNIEELLAINLPELIPADLSEPLSLDLPDLEALLATDQQYFADLIAAGEKADQELAALLKNQQILSF